MAIIMIIIIIIIIITMIIIRLIKYQVGIWWGILRSLMGRKNLSALRGSLSRDGVSIKNWLVETIKHNLIYSEISN